MSLLPRLPLFVATLTLLSLALALIFLSGQPVPAPRAKTDTTTTTTAIVDYDSNDDRLIEISNLAQLNAIRWDLNGDGTVDAAANRASYIAAFPNAAAGMGCPDGSDADTTPAPCLGYELKADLGFDSNGDGSVTAADSGGLYWNGGAGWRPIGGLAAAYTGQFQGRGKVISHLFINSRDAAAGAVGLFGAVGAGGQVVGLGLEQVSIAAANLEQAGGSGSRAAAVGSLAGVNAGSITASYATGTITTAGATAVSPGAVVAGGLIGQNYQPGKVQASFAAVNVAVNHNGRAGAAGGLVGHNNRGKIRASYATGRVAVNGGNSQAGGLAGSNRGAITASYARGRVAFAGAGSVGGGLAGVSYGPIIASYWDTATSGQTASAGGRGQSSRELQSPTGYSGIYANWNLNLDGTAGGDSPWDFGGDGQYPMLAYGTVKAAPQRDYDADNDRLLEVNNLAQLNAIRWDLNADGAVAAADQGSYTAAFPGAVAGLGCALGAIAGACNGYELMADLDFDTDGDGAVAAADSGGLYWNGERGWRPIGAAADGSHGGSFTGIFQGNGKTIANLYINHTQGTTGLGLFSYVRSPGVIESVKLRAVNIRVQEGSAGALAAHNYGIIRNSSATGRINAASGVHYAVVGGLAGQNFGSLTSSYAKVDITGSATVAGGLAGRSSSLLLAGKDAVIVASYATGAVSSTRVSDGGYYNAARVGGLVGYNDGTIAASYSRSPVKADDNYAKAGGLVGMNSGTITAAYSRSPVKATGKGASVGGLVGWNARTRHNNILQPGIIRASYATGPVVATGINPFVGGLVGWNGSKSFAGTAVDSYWDLEISGQSGSPLGMGILGTGSSGTGLRAYGPKTYIGNFANWNLNLDGVAGNDAPWTFPHGQYPILKYGGLSVADQVQLYLWNAPAVGRLAKTNWHLGSWLTRTPGQALVWERSADGASGWTVVRSRQAGIGGNRWDNGSARLFIEPYEANQRFRVRGHTVEGGWVGGYISPPAAPWSGPTATLTFASGHTAPRVGQAIAISGTNNVKWIRCADTADNGCEVIVRAATGYTPVAADQGKYLYAYRYYDDSQGVKTMGKTAYIGPVAAASSS